MINSTQSINNAQTNINNQPSVVKPDVHRQVRSHSTPLTSEGDLSDVPMDAGSLQVSSQHVKNLSRYFNTFRAYANQIDYSDRILNKVAHGVGD